MALGEGDRLSQPDRPLALVTAPFRGDGLEELQSLVDVVLDPWIEQSPLRIYGPDELRSVPGGKGPRS